jgi:hypothetical protein
MRGNSQVEGASPTALYASRLADRTASQGTDAGGPPPGDLPNAAATHSDTFPPLEWDLRQIADHRPGARHHRRRPGRLIHPGGVRSRGSRPAVFVRLRRPEGGPRLLVSWSAGARAGWSRARCTASRTR